ATPVASKIEFEQLFTYVAVITAAVSCAILRGMDNMHQKQVLSKKEKDSSLLGVTSLLDGIIPGDALVWVISFPLIPQK
uniref:Uncharacterized protein n=1 Tax=Pseudonaja textilis TaxID=8673 RepID=A0A670YQA3_PSETE